MTHNGKDNRLTYFLIVLAAIIISVVILVSLAQPAQAERLDCSYSTYAGVPFVLCEGFTSQKEFACNLYEQESCISPISTNLFEVEPERFTTYERQLAKVQKTIDFIMKWQGTHLDSLVYYQ